MVKSSLFKLKRDARTFVYWKKIEGGTLTTRSVSFLVYLLEYM